MSIRVFLDSIEITDALNEQYPLPAQMSASGIFPDNTRSHWYDLLDAINQNPTLKTSFFDSPNALHEFKVEDSRQGGSFSARVYLSTKYSSRNR